MRQRQGRMMRPDMAGYVIENKGLIWLHRPQAFAHA